MALTSAETGKIEKAKALLQIGHSSQQVARQLRLKKEVVVALESELTTPEQLQPQIETPEQWEVRKAHEVQKKIVALGETHLDTLGKYGPGALLEPKTMQGYAEASNTLHKWLVKNKEQTTGKNLSVNFNLLANAQPSMKTLDVKTETQSDGTTED